MQVQTDDVSSVKHTILQHLPVFQYNEGGEDQQDSQLVNSTYLDNSSLELYHGRLDKRPNALALRIRCSPECQLSGERSKVATFAGQHLPEQQQPGAAPQAPGQAPQCPGPAHQVRPWLAGNALLITIQAACCAVCLCLHTVGQCSLWLLALPGSGSVGSQVARVKCGPSGVGSNKPHSAEYDVSIWQYCRCCPTDACG